MLREDLVSRLWGNVVVTDDALTRCFYELRRHLSQAGGDERYRDLIETLPKRGYRLKATVAGAHVTPLRVRRARSRQTPAVRRSRRGSLPSPPFVLAAIGVAALLLCGRRRTPSRPRARPRHSIAVLPFLDMSAAKDQGYLADGVTEEILNHLSQAKQPARDCANVVVRAA